MPKIVTARDGDTLCGIAMDAGFINCGPLRAEPANSALLSGSLKQGDQVTVPDLNEKQEDKATEKLHRFVKKNAPPVSIRFVHGSPDKKYLEDDTLTVLNVSNFVTNKGGNDGSKNFPTGFGFNPDGHADEDSFKVEVVDPAAGGSVNVVLEALKLSGVNPDGTPKHVPITGAPDAAQRKRDALECQQVRAGHVAFRTRYMRLVVDSNDFTAQDPQTLLTTDLVDAGEEDVEILDQKVRASYVIQRCPGTGGAKCRPVSELEIGEDEKRVRVAAHILKDPVTGTAVANQDQVRKSCLKYIRQLYAQANMKFRFVAAIREVPAPANLIAIANGNGQLAAGGQTLSVRVRINNNFDQVCQITTTANDPPIATANKLAAVIIEEITKAGLPIAVPVKVTANPPLVGQAIGSADIVVGNPLTQTIRLTVVTSNDLRHPVLIGRIRSTTIPDFGGNDAHVGTIEERVLVKNYDSGADRIDLFIVGTLGSGALGEAFIPNQTRPAGRQPITEMVNTALVFAATTTQKDNFHTTIPHELGHILMDANHATVATEMMGSGSPVGANERVVNGPKRISDRAIAFDDGQNGNAVTFLRTKNTAVTE